MGIPPTILVVDDDLGFRKTLGDILIAKGYDVVAVSVGQTALEHIVTALPLVALIDLKLEDMSGLDLLRAIKQQTDKIECILLTGYATQNSAIEAVNLGAYGYMQKPYDVEQLLVMIQRAIEKQEAAASLRAYAERLTILNQQALQEINERKRVEAALEAERASLTERVAERTAALQKANAELAHASKLKDEFLANMSHELRTPLNAVLGLSEALQEQVYGTLNMRQQKALNTIEESGRHLLSIINDILDISKIEAGKFPLQLGPVGIETLCQASLRLIKQDAHNKQLNITYHCHTEATVIQADQRRLKQVLVNLLSNAVKFTLESGSIGLEVVDDPIQKEIRFLIWDTGIGISDEDLKLLFEPFIQLDSRLARQYPGTGLGLALVKRITELHGGSVLVTSQPDQGSRFTISLPQPHLFTSFPKITIPPDTPQPSTQLLLPHKVLIIEDIPTAIEQLTYYLTELGIEAVVHKQATGAAKLAQQTQPDVIVLDLLLPDHSGWTVLSQLKDDPLTKNIPVIIHSIVDEPPRPITDVAEYLVKPISRQQFQASLSHVMASAKSAADRMVVLVPEPPVILLVEDNPASIEVLAEHLKQQGYQIIVARNGQEAIQQAKTDCPALILMDIQLSDMDGLAAIKHIRAEKLKSIATIPIIALTALNTPDEEARYLEVGADAYLKKPMKYNKLMSIIEKHIS